MTVQISMELLDSENKGQSFHFHLGIVAFTNRLRDANAMGCSCPFGITAPTPYALASPANHIGRVGS